MQCVYCKPFLPPTLVVVSRCQSSDRDGSGGHAGYGADVVALFSRGLGSLVPWAFKQLLTERAWGTLRTQRCTPVSSARTKPQLLPASSLGTFPPDYQWDSSWWWKIMFLALLLGSWRQSLAQSLSRSKLYKMGRKESRSRKESSSQYFLRRLGFTRESWVMPHNKRTWVGGRQRSASHHCIHLWSQPGFMLSGQDVMRCM